MRTRQQLIVATLDLLNVTQAGQDPEPEDVTKVDELIDGQLSELNTLRIINFTNRKEFDDQFIDPLATVMANAAAPSFGQPRNPDSLREARNRLREMRNSSWTADTVTPSLYF